MHFSSEVESSAACGPAVWMSAPAKRRVAQDWCSELGGRAALITAADILTSRSKHENCDRGILTYLPEIYYQCKGRTFKYSHAGAEAQLPRERANASQLSQASESGMTGSPERPESSEQIE